MNISRHFMARSIMAVAVIAVLIAGCASTPQPPAGSAEVRAKLSALQSDPTLAGQAPVAIKDAELAVEQAEIIQPDVALAAHRVYIADRMVDTARAQADIKLAEEQRTALNERSEKARLDSRTREADAARLAASASREETSDLQRQLEALQAQPTDRGLVLTLGDTLFATGRSELNDNASENLDRVGYFLVEYPARTAKIEGFTDSRGDEDYNMVLSQHRADSVKRYLVGLGVKPEQLTTRGRGENAPVADNATVAGRVQNRRVEVVISQEDGGEWGAN